MARAKKTKLEENIEKTVEEQKEAERIEEKHKEWTEENALKCAQGLAAHAEPDTLTQPLGERGDFETKAEVHVDDELYEAMADELKGLIKQIADKSVEAKGIKKELDELNAKMDEIVTDLANKKTKVTIMGHWEYDWDNDVKRLRGKYKGNEIIVSTVDLTPFDRQMKLDDAIDKAQELKNQNSPEKQRPERYQIPSEIEDGIKARVFPDDGEPNGTADDGAESND